MELCIFNCCRQGCRPNEMKRLLQIFGLLDIITLVRSYKHIIPQSTDWNEFPLTTIGNLLLYSSLVFSAYFLLTQKKAGLWVTYGQFPLRFAFVVFSFGFLFTMNRFFDNQSESYRIIFWVLAGLEILRLICTIHIHRKYSSPTKVTIR